MKVVLDTNVLVAAFIAHGSCAELLEEVIGHHELLVSDFILRELEETLAHKLSLSPEKVARAVALIRRVGVRIVPQPLDRQVCRDADDDAVLALARSSGASCVVTGDADLLILGSYAGCPIIPPREFWTRLGSSS